MTIFLGKVAILGAIVAVITVLPAVALWLAGVLVSPSIVVAAETWDLPLRAVAARQAQQPEAAPVAVLGLLVLGQDAGDHLRGGNTNALRLQVHVSTNFLMYTIVAGYQGDGKTVLA